MATNLSAPIGDDVVIEIPVVDADGDAYTVTGAQAWAYAKSDLSVADNAATLSATTAGGTISISGSTVTVTFPAAQTAALTADTTLYWACRIKESGNSQVTTLDDGILDLRLISVKTYA